jgi:hypothetical protein
MNAEHSGVSEKIKARSVKLIPVLIIQIKPTVPAGFFLEVISCGKAAFPERAVPCPE